jgi:hypothetical protein
LVLYIIISGQSRNLYLMEKIFDIVVVGAGEKVNLGGKSHELNLG